MQAFFSAIDSTTTCLNSLQQLSNNYHEGMTPGGRSGRLVSATTIDTSDAPALSSQHGVSSDPPIGNTSTFTATKRNGGGSTRRKALEKMTKSTGKLSVTIDPLKGRSTDAVQSAKLSSELGIISRDVLPTVTRWKDVTEHQKIEDFHRLHNEMVQLRSQQTSTETTMTSTQVVENVLGWRSSYIVGQGYGPKLSSSRSMISADHQENKELREANKELREALSASRAETAEMNRKMEDMQSQFAEFKQFMMVQSQTFSIVTSSGSRRSSAPQVP